MDILKAASIKALVRDFKEVLENPAINISAVPLEDDLYVWHGSVRSSEGSLKDAPVHFLLIFPKTYPQSGPECRLFQPVPHPSVVSAVGIAVPNSSRHVPREARWRLALWDCVPGHDAWSSSCTVASVLQQLQVFLLDEDLQYDERKITPEAAIAQALKFECPQCSHTGKCPYPAFPTDADLAAARQLAPKVRVAKPFVPARARGATLALQLHQQARTKRPAAASAAAAAAAVPAAAATNHTVLHGKVSEGAGSGSSSDSGVAEGATAAQPSGGPAGDDGWQMVKGKHSAKAVQMPLVAKHVADDAASSTSGSSSRFSVLKADVVKQLDQQAKRPAASAQQQNEEQQAGQQQEQGQQAAAGGKLSKAAKKNLQRSLKRQAGKQGAAASSASTRASTTTVAPSGAAASGCSSSSTSAAPAAAASAADGAVWQDVQAKAKHQPAASSSTIGLLSEAKQLLQQDPKQLIAEVRAEHAAAAAASTSGPQQQQQWQQQQQQQWQHGMQPELHSDLGCEAGPFSALPRDVVLGLLGLLRPASIAALACACKGLRASCEDGALWQTLLAAHYPGHQVAASQLSQWKHAYVLEANSLLGELRCFYTRAGFEEEVLGLPITFTVNPVTKAVDYIEAHPDLLSLAAFKAGVRRTPQGEKFDAVLPVYLTAEHFQRALPHLQSLLKQLAPEKVGRGGTPPSPAVWLEVLPKILNTLVVLLSDRGVVASQRMLQVYCSVHRLLLAVCEFYGLWADVAARLDTFVARPGNRTKAACSNLGLLLPLLSLSPRHTWQKLCAAIMSEALDRKVLWMCKNDPSLVENFNKGQVPADDRLLAGSYEGARVSCRLILFHVGFLQLVACPPDSSLEAVMDAYDGMYGLPGVALSGRFLAFVKRVLEVSSWSDFFGAARMVVPSPVTMTNMLRRAWGNSLAKKYHKEGMDFSRVQASGVSKILLKGETFSAPPNLKKVKLEVNYAWASGYMRYLDGACLLFGPNGTFLEAVAWNHCHSDKTQVHGAVTHSGDIMDPQDRRGLNYAWISLAGLGAGVQQVYITLSAWLQSKLVDIQMPYVQFTDGDSGMQLCTCHVDDFDKASRTTHKCIIMARLFRANNGQGWAVQALGKLCTHGDTSNYGPQLEAIRQLPAV